MASGHAKRSTSSKKPEADFTVEDLAEYIGSLPKTSRILDSGALPDYFANSKPSKESELPRYKLNPMRSSERIRSSQGQSERPYYNDEFAKWQKYLEYGFNVLLYGVGSKIDLLNSFFLALEDECPTNRLKIYAFQPSFSLRKLLSKLQQVISKDTGYAFSHIVSLTDALTATLAGLDYCLKDDPHYSITICLHSLDAANLKSEDSQSQLSKLANHPCIRLVATCDHVQLPRLWSLSVLAQFNFVSFGVPTYEPYSQEISFSRESLRFFNKHSEDSAIQGLRNVIQSMTLTQHSVLKFLVDICREHSKTQVSVKELLQRCKAEFILTTEKQLMDYLLESRDHQVLVEKRTQRGERVLALLYPVETLAQTLNC